MANATGLEALLRALRDLGVPMRIHPQHESVPHTVDADAFDLLWEGKKEPLAVYVETITYRSPARDEPGEFNELHMERVTIERYRT